MIVAIIRSRLRAEGEAEYLLMAKAMNELAKTITGYITHKGFTAEDGERVTIVEFESEEALRHWAVHPEHIKAKQAGRRRLFAEYRVQICHNVQDGGVKSLL